ncbi:HEXXH motif domain-containing protein [Streptomyces sp. NPDC002054]|uniref:HEXXH motif domain-containing protein n=1 Tax=Streptomyces sp. NPDC002054 TaxID=3154663 RepID=UPI003319C420
MASSQHGGHLRMPGRWFDQLASGGGSSEAVAFLVRAERTRRLMLLGELLDRLDERPEVLGGLGSAGTAWQLIAEAAEAEPEAVEELLMSPQIGCWTAHLLRRLHGTAEETADGPPLWADAGHLFAICLAARIRAGLDADVLVPVRNGGLALPTLGHAGIDGSRGYGTATARLRGGDLHLTPHAGSRSGGRTITVRPGDGVGSSSHWRRARTFAGTPTWLDDLDPYRELGEPVLPQPLDSAAAEDWQRLFTEAAAVLGPSGTGPGQLRVEEVRRIVPWTGTPSAPAPDEPAMLSATTSDAFGSMLIARPEDGLALAETMVHEFQHSKLGALLHLFPLLHDDGAEIHYAPWRPDPRHTAGLLHGAYAFTGVTGFWRDRMADERAAPEHAAFHFGLRRLQTRLVVRTLLTRARLTDAGTRFLHGLAATLDGWLRERLPADVAARARDAALSHRIEWRLRNLRCTDGERALLATACHEGLAPPPASAHQPVLIREPTHWTDPRTPLYGAPPRTPATADAHLAAGDPRTALALYTEALRDCPSDPHTLGGWLLARARLSPTAHRLPLRPERLLALAPTTPEELHRATAWLTAGN